MAVQWGFCICIATELKTASSTFLGAEGVGAMYLSANNLADIFMFLQIEVFVFGFINRRLFFVSCAIGIISILFRFIWFWEMM